MIFGDECFQKNEQNLSGMLGGPIFLVNTQKPLNHVQVMVPNKENDKNVNIWDERNFKINE